MKEMRNERVAADHVVMMDTLMITNGILVMIVDRVPGILMKDVVTVACKLRYSKIGLGCRLREMVRARKDQQ